MHYVLDYRALRSTMAQPDSNQAKVQAGLQQMGGLTV